MNKYLANNKPIKVVANNHQDWLKLRSGIGSSEVAVIMGCSKWSTPYQLWLDKTGRMPHEEQENVILKMGHLLEPVVADLWQESTGMPIIAGSDAEYMYVHPELDFLRASPDREFMMDVNERGILECKTCQYPIDAEQLPEYWFCQVQYQLGLAQLDYANIAWLVQGRDFGYAEINFNPDFFAYMIEETKKFWFDCVIGGKEPECENHDDIILKYASSHDKEAAANEHIAGLYDRLKEVRGNLSDLKIEEENLKNEIQLFMKDCDRITYEGKLLATWKSAKDREVFDEARFKKENQDLYNKYIMTRAGSRTFRVK